jgi:hypothetical protein
VLRQLLIQLALARKLEHEEDPLFVVEVAVQPQDVRVSDQRVSERRSAQEGDGPKVGLDLDLPPDLLLDLALDELRLVQAFEREDVLFLLGPDHVDAFRR